MLTFRESFCLGERNRTFWDKVTKTNTEKAQKM